MEMSAPSHYCYVPLQVSTCNYCFFLYMHNSYVLYWYGTKKNSPARNLTLYIYCWVMMLLLKPEQWRQGSWSRGRQQNSRWLMHSTLSSAILDILGFEDIEGLGVDKRLLTYQTSRKLQNCGNLTLPGLRPIVWAVLFTYKMLKKR